MKILLLVFFILWLAGAIYGLTRRPAAGFAITGPWRRAAALEFFFDVTYERDGHPVHEQHILPAMLAAVEQAEYFIIIDLFLFNDIGGDQVLGPELTSPVARLTEALLVARRRRPELAVLFICDEINTGYGSYPEPHLARLAAAGVEVVVVDLARLPDSNPAYSGLWRPLLQWFKPGGRGRLPNIFAAGAPGMNLASYLRLLNFKANHRKLLITEQLALVSSRNIHDASARHSNIAFLVRGGIIADLAAAEVATARFSGHDFILPRGTLPVASPLALDDRDGEAVDDVAALEPVVRLLTESAIGEALLQALNVTRAGDRIWVAQFYLADRRVMAALAVAARRGVAVRLLLDPSRDAFGRDKHGIPNRSSAAWLKARGGEKLRVRWYNTRGEQFHVKMTMIERAPADGERAPAGRVTIIGGSANLTRRNLTGYNLESCLEIRAAATAPVAVAVHDFFHRLWHNREGCYLVDYEKYAEQRPLKAAWVAWQEFSGMGTF
ncbi:phospholipase D-like domain-containing protein [Desulfurivibrio dismutans]|uniref:phospholipase D-like domain-containing protein n=1 Tax=Desulfurivibrio dismutans TaxID=1398908 RepID=UPI0023DCB9EA|nr:phospholipase D-like domain-containing protein [Desulfurivibrio alkaliphilus]MDF1614468.1 phospholipase D-like domain-containing protein [Desulfurivibrio alkaliphilus]